MSSPHLDGGMISPTVVGVKEGRECSYDLESLDALLAKALVVENTEGLVIVRVREKCLH
jgi:hypothetical protein